MKRIELQLTNFEQAKALKELGFPQNIYTSKVYLEKTIPYDINAKECDLSDWQCIGGKLIPCSSDYNKYGIDTCSCPTLELAAKWLREEKDLWIHMCKPNQDNTKWSSSVNGISRHLWEPCSEYDTYEEALSAGINKAIKLLILKI